MIINAFDYDDVANTFISNRNDAGNASGPGAAHLGVDTLAIGADARGSYSTVLGGDGCSASGDYGVSAGEGCDAAGTASVAFGYRCTAGGNNSFATGSGCTAQGDNAFATGSVSNAKGNNAVAFGGCAAEGDHSLAAGSATAVYGTYSSAMGHHCIVGDPLVPGEASLGALAIGQQTEVHANHGFTQGEDTRVYGDSSVALNHFNRVDGRASIAVGCNHLVPSERSFACGFAARPRFNTQWALGGAGFTVNGYDPNEASKEGLHNAIPALTGHAQTSLLVLRGETPGEVSPEIASYEGSPMLCYGPVRGEAYMPLEDGKAYAVKATAIVNGRIGIIPCQAMIVGDALVVKDGGTCSLVDGGAPVPPVLKSPNAESFRLEIKVNPTYGVYVEVSTGDQIAKVRVACRLEITEVILPMFD